MLYLEDYLEMIEHLPQELRDRFTDMREMDLSIHNNTDELEKREKAFFSDCKKYQNQDIPPNLEAEFQAIRKEYYKALEDADEKVHLANTMYELVDKYLRRLDSELHKFKYELEADNKGITEVLKKRSLELDTPANSSNMLSQQKENRYDSLSSNNYSSRYSRPRSEKRRDSNSTVSNQFVEKRQMLQQPVPASSTGSLPPALAETRHTPTITPQNSLPTSSVAPTGISYGLGHNLGAGTAIAAAASQAIAATQQMQQGRRTASLKASYEAINTSGHEFIPRELAGAAQTAIQAIQQDHANNKKKQKKYSNNSSSSSSQQLAPIPVQQPATLPEVQPAQTDSTVAEVADGEWVYDPNEPRYCLCNQVSYGDMVACDNEECPSEWFHYPCVGISAPPKGKWYCPQCTTTMKRRGGRKN
ncbi:inhibitor of growth protein 3 [Euwallacea similis]|uniref:inhibitor of growth protein 3 n=1 Tax=Euwallacea similis TaxID=1736056 RepID=UPI00344D6A5D